MIKNSLLGSSQKPVSLKSISLWLSLVVLVVNFAALAVWLFGSEPAVLFVIERINVNAAAALFFGGTSLFLLDRAPKKLQMTYVARALSFFPIIIGLLSLIEIIWGLESGLVLLFGKTGALLSRPLPTQVAPNAALSYFLLGSSIFFLDFKGALGRWAQYFAVTSAAISIVALIGYLYQAPQLYQVGEFQKMMPLAAFSILMLSLSVLFMRPNFEVIRILASQTSGGYFARRILIATVLVPPVFGWFGYLAGQIGWADKTLSFALVAAASVLFLVGLTWRTVSIMNTTEEKRLRSEEILAVERSKLATVIENMPAGLMIADAPSGRLLLVNNTIDEILRFPFKAQTSSNSSQTYQEARFVWEAYHLDGRRYTDTEWPMDRTLNHGEVIRNEEMWIRRGDESLAVISVYSAPIFDENGRIQAGVCIIFDITGKKRQEEWTKISATISSKISPSNDYEKILGELATSSVPALADICFLDIMDNDKKIRRVAWSHADLLIHEQLTAAFSADPFQVREESCAIFQTIYFGRTVFIETVTKEWLEQAANGSAEKLEFLQNLKLKSIITVPIGTPSTCLGALSFYVTNFSGRQYEISDLNNAQELANYLTIALENVFLYQESVKSKEAAEAANAAKTRFLANMSHEIRTPLGAITGFLELIKNPDNTRSDILSYMSIVERNSQQLLRLIDDILDLSKVEAGKMVIEKIPFSLADLLGDIDSLFGFRAQEKGVTFKISVIGKVPDRVTTDLMRLRQILSNLLGNAIKFTDRGQILLTISYKNNCLYFSIEDTGRGIAASESQHLFQPFAQADPSTTRKFGGTGLGLVLSRRLAQALGGDVLLKKSAPQTGSEFEVRVQAPSAADSNDLKDNQWRLEKSLNAAEPSLNEKLKGLMILIVEDSPDNQVLVTTFLRKAGAKTEIASNGEEGVVKALQGSFDIILMDVQMPKMDGYEAMKTLRSQGFEKPIIALTAHAMQEERQRCFEAGATEHLAKPLHRETLLNTISQLVGREQKSQVNDSKEMPSLDI